MSAVAAGRGFSSGHQWPTSASLTDALTTDEPEISTARYVLGWFRKKVSALADAVRNFILNPLISRIVGAAGDGAAADFEQFLHDLPGA